MAGESRKVLCTSIWRLGAEWTKQNRGQYVSNIVQQYIVFIHEALWWAGTYYMFYYRMALFIKWSAHTIRPAHTQPAQGIVLLGGRGRYWPAGSGGGGHAFGSWLWCVAVNPFVWTLEVFCSFLSRSPRGMSNCKTVHWLGEWKPINGYCISPLIFNYLFADVCPQIGCGVSLLSWKVGHDTRDMLET